MDPNETLANLRNYADHVVRHSGDTYAVRLAEHFQALDEWLSKGGFRPREWSAARTFSGQAGAVEFDAIPHYEMQEFREWQRQQKEAMREWAQAQAIRAAEPLGGPVPGVNGHPPEHVDE